MRVASQSGFALVACIARPAFTQHRQMPPRLVITRCPYTRSMDCVARWSSLEWVALALSCCRMRFDSGTSCTALQEITGPTMSGLLPRRRLRGKAGLDGEACHEAYPTNDDADDEPEPCEAEEVKDEEEDDAVVAVCEGCDQTAEDLEKDWLPEQEVIIHCAKKRTSRRTGKVKRSGRECYDCFAVRRKWYKGKSAAWIKSKRQCPKFRDQHASKRRDKVRKSDHYVRGAGTKHHASLNRRASSCKPSSRGTFTSLLTT